MPAVRAAWLAASSIWLPREGALAGGAEGLDVADQVPLAYRANRARFAGTLPLMTRGALVAWHQPVAGDAARENLLRTDLITR